MAFTNSKMTALTATVTAAGSAALKVEACLPGLLDVVFREVSESTTLTPQAQNRLTTLRADLAANYATMQTALGL